MPKKSEKKEKKITVFSRAFIELQHKNSLQEEQEFIVECNKDGELRSFRSLDEANNFASDHRRENPGHRLMVTTVQHSA